MNKPIHGHELNRVLLKPRFKIELDEEIRKKAKKSLKRMLEIV